MDRSILLLIFLISCICNSQGEGGVFTQSRLAALRTGEGSLGNNPHAIEWINQLRIKTAALGEGQNISLDDIEGTVYLNEDFQEGKVFYLGEHYQTFPLRYDAYNDEVEIERNPDALEALHKNSAISCEILNKRLEYRKYRDRKGALGEGYFFAIYIGMDKSLFLRHSKKFKEAKEAKTSLQNSFPHRFVDDKTFYVDSGDGYLSYLKNNRENIVSLFENEKDIKKFIKSNNLSLNNEDDLKRIFVFADAKK